MANPRWQIVVSVEDGEGKTGTLTAYHNSAVYADAYSAAQNIGDLVSQMITGVVRRVTLTETVFNSADVPAADSDVEIKAAFTFNNADGKAYQASVPTFNRAKMLPNSDRVDITDLDVAAFITALTGAAYTDSRAIDLVSLRSALEQFTRRRNR